MKIWSHIFMVFLVLLFVGVFFGGKAKLRYEKEALRTKVRELKETAV